MIPEHPTSCIAADHSNNISIVRVKSHVTLLSRGGSLSLTRRGQEGQSTARVCLLCKHVLSSFEKHKYIVGGRQVVVVVVVGA